MPEPTEALGEFVGDGLDDDEAFDPFAPENIPVLQFVTLQRIYDALMLSNVLKDYDATKKLHELHAQGKLLGTSPNWDGIFAGDESTADS